MTNQCSEGLTEEECSGSSKTFHPSTSCEELGYEYYCKGKDIWLDGSGGCYD